MIKMGLVLLLGLASETLQQTPQDPPDVRVIKNIDLGFTGDQALSNVSFHSSRVMCIYDTRTSQWDGQPSMTNKVEMEYIDATLCTHLVFRPVMMKRVNGTMNFVLMDGHTKESYELFKKAVELKKQKNPNLKVILSFGGWSEGIQHFQNVSNSHEILPKFVTKFLNLLQENSFDGLNVVWAWPVFTSSGRNDSDTKERNKNALTELIVLLRNNMTASLELGVTLPADTSLIKTGYNIPALESYVDYFILMGDWEDNGKEGAAHHSPLYPLTGRTVGNSVNFVLDKNIPSRKLILGIPFLGRALTLIDPHINGSGLGAPTQEKVGFRSAYFNMDDIAYYYMICIGLTAPRDHRNKLRIYEDSEAKVSFIKRVDNGYWISFEDPKSVRAKVEFGEERGLGGYAAWPVTSDDYPGEFCGDGITFPLLRTINYVISKKQSKTRESNTTNSSVITYVVVSLVGVSLLLVAVFCLLWRKRKRNESGLSDSEIRRFKKGYTYAAVTDKRSTQSIMMVQLQGEDNINGSPYESYLEILDSEYEISPSEILGIGAYGVVLKGIVRNEVVAVKTVKPLSSKEYVLSLLEEIKVMTYLGQHKNILGLIGANTALLRLGIVYVFVEFCPLGSLEKYLKVNKSSFGDLKENGEFTRETSPAKKDGEGMSSATLLIWAHQISNGMEFLASKKVVHGDLATRNVLLRSKHLVKIADFGLSRKMYEYCNYFKKKQEPLPWRHMSLEALKNMEFSTKSDVWAFGVTLWEIFTLGDIPYPGMSYTLGFIEDLSGGLRMYAPKYATPDLYDKTMLQTWNEHPKDRPSFEELSVFLRDAVERVSLEQEYMNVSDYTN